MKNTVAEIKKIKLGELGRAKWGEGEYFEESVKIGQWKSPSLINRKQIK